MGRLFDSQTGQATPKQASTGRLFKEPVVKQKTAAGRVISGAGKIVKETLKPVATLAVRPLQAAAELSGASAETVDANTKRMFDDWVAPTPKSGKDVVKDIGRGIQTVALGVPVAGRAASLGRRLAQNAAAGSAFGVGASLEQGNKLISKETAKQAIVGGALGAAIPEGFTALGRLFKTKPKAVVPDVVEKEIVGTGDIPTKTIEPEIKQPAIQTTEPTPQKSLQRSEIIQPPNEQKAKQQKKIRDDIEVLSEKFDETEDPKFNKGTFEGWKQEVDMLSTKYSADDLTDYVFGKNQTIKTNAPKNAVYELLANRADLTDAQRHRLITNRFTESSAGQGLVATQLRTGLNDYMAKKNQLLKENLKNKGITGKTTKRFLDDLEC